MKNKISACLVVHNEEKVINRCLTSIKNVVDEIIVVHDGECADRTLEICKVYTDKIFVKQEASFMEEHIPFAFSKCEGNWILRIDADEMLSKELRDNIKILLEDNFINGYEFLWPFWDGHKEVTINWPYKLCLFRKSKISFLGIVHHNIVVKGKIKKENFKLCHQPEYNNFSWELFKTKWLKWARIQAKCYLSPFTEIKKFNYEKKDWSKKIKFRIKYPLFSMLMVFIVAFFKNFKILFIKNYVITFKYFIFSILYSVAVNYYIYKYKKNAKKN